MPKPSVIKTALKDFNKASSKVSGKEFELDLEKLANDVLDTFCKVETDRQLVKAHSKIKDYISLLDNAYIDDSSDRMKVLTKDFKNMSEEFSIDLRIEENEEKAKKNKEEVEETVKSALSVLEEVLPKVYKNDKASLLSYIESISKESDSEEEEDDEGVEKGEEDSEEDSDDEEVEKGEEESDSEEEDDEEVEKGEEDSEEDSDIDEESSWDLFQKTINDKDSPVISPLKKQRGF